MSTSKIDTQNEPLLAVLLSLFLLVSRPRNAVEQCAGVGRAWAVDREAGSAQLAQPGRVQPLKRISSSRISDRTRHCVQLM